ncbi:MAG: type VI secretion system protein TssL [Oceanospirillaceae bacterium]|uniref:flagellar motor protein MotB n=1 Tax=unclassified Thalassolituus TaxID=2624967 RepID=UPI000C0981C3|nr:MULTISPECIES: flagellar motor protein MotB [unclassified Thalassolituus]MAK91353.1 type VI secretion system protein TssL [Thalassolituus sp.]MAS26142.1 type VI secretion system protein TssL [Oceanospirillaceae bacterium]MAY00423.1 type VI secretion system protein TssL [Oceanospirillaceae bacterium]MBL34033.1 type VI secretion system protein TssL [Oceanospirillaceae bacterium]MBS52037.1 type VI secretion system protein TssL [Oceanospirillaceae bacterium]|tara:strand:- start:3771 stop:4748 length:978 start_codon:yes stop_codon:yes gene_type:complete
MSAEEEQECPPCPAIPGWLATFADLMSLLMCFFVLLLSFSEMDALKFKRLAGELRQAFGVQTVVNVSDPPKGTSVIARHFSPSIPEPTPINEVRQKTSDITKSSLEVLCQDEVTQQEERQGDQGELTREVVVPKEDMENEKTEEEAMKMAAKLENEIAQGQVEIETVGKKIIIRIQQRGAFRSGSDYIEDRFLPVIDKIREVLVTIPGMISVEGHTDDIPVSGGRFRSNWTLSSARAAAFAEELFVAPEMDESRFQIVGHADTQPLVANDSPEARERNRRVEIIILRKQPGDDDDVPEIETDDAAVNDALNAQPEDFELRPNEIF